jgi:hypothetical protein
MSCTGVLGRFALACTMGLWGVCDLAQAQPESSGVATAHDARLMDDGKVIVIKAEAGFVFKDAPGAGDTANMVRWVREEVISKALAQKLSGRSVIFKLDFDCARKVTAVRDVEVYPENGLVGAATPIEPMRWLAANANLDLSGLIDGACSSSPPSASVAINDGSDMTRSPPSEPIKAAEPPDSPKRLETGGRGRWVQIGAYGSMEGASQAARALSSHTPLAIKALSSRIEPAQIGDRQLFRALIGPFATLDQARTFCIRIKTIGSDCLVR